MNTNVLIVTAHPHLQSFNHALSETATQVFEQANLSVVRHNLYQENFNAAAGAADFKVPLNTELGELKHTNLLQLQHQAGNQKLLSDDIVAEQGKLNRADLILLQFPIWWGSMPALLKGWLERVFTYGYAYGEQFSLAGKPVMMSVTTGGAWDASEEKYYQDKIQTLAEETFGYMKMRCLPPFICHGPANGSQGSRAAELERYRDSLKSLIAGRKLNARDR